VGQVYSESLSADHAGGGKDINPVTGTRTVLRWVTAFNASALVGETFHMFDSVTGITILQVVISQRSSYVQELRVVLWDTFVIQFLNDSDIDYTVSGYRLTLP